MVYPELLLNQYRVRKKKELEVLLKVLAKVLLGWLPDQLPVSSILRVDLLEQYGGKTLNFLNNLDIIFEPSSLICFLQSYGYERRN